MEKYTMFMDQKNQSSENEYTTQSNLQIQRNPYKLPMVFFTELEQNLYGNTKNLEQPKQS